MTKKKQETFDFKLLAGHKAELFVCPNVPNQFQLGSIIFEVIEDESDGYRSMMQEIVVVERNASVKKQHLANVKIQVIDDGYFNGFALVQLENNHTWLRFGTENADDYYPCFRFEWKTFEEFQKENVQPIIDGIKKRK